MKNIVMIILGILITSVSYGQNDAISRFFDKYVEDEDFTQITITSRMFSLLSNLEMESEEDKELIEAISKVDGLKILAKDHTADGKTLYKEAFAKIPTNEYDELMSVRDKSTDFKFLIKEKDGVIAELLMIMGGDSEFFLLSLVGDIDLKQISKLSKSMSIDGFEHLEKIDDGN